MKTELLSYVDSQRLQLIKAAQDLVRQDSSNPPGDVTKAALSAIDIIRNLIPDGVEISKYEPASGIVNVVAIIRGLGEGPNRRLVFSGHLDTYPIGDEDQWTVSPFGGLHDEENGRLYGRGAADMKGGIAASILAAAALAQFREHWSGEVVIALAGDEETMGELGTGYLLKNVESVRRADAVICGDAGSPNIIRIGEKGLVWMDVEATGTAAHGAHVHKGDNAIERLMEALWRLKKIENMTLSPVLETVNVIDGAFAVSEVLGGEGEANILKTITVNIGKISGGTSPNLVPDKATASLDIRLPDGVSTDGLIRRAQQCLDDLRGVTFHVRNKYEPSFTNPDEKIVQDAEAAVRDVISTEYAVNMRVGASDTRLFRRVDIPSVVIGLTPYNMGGPDEYCLTEELLQVCKIHALAAWRYLQ